MPSFIIAWGYWNFPAYFIEKHGARYRFSRYVTKRGSRWARYDKEERALIV